jgi:hypothetical protein
LTLVRAFKNLNHLFWFLPQATTSVGRHKREKPSSANKRVESIDSNYYRFLPFFLPLSTAKAFPAQVLHSLFQVRSLTGDSPGAFSLHCERRRGLRDARVEDAKAFSELSNGDAMTVSIAPAVEYEGSNPFRVKGRRFSAPVRCSGLAHFLGLGRSGGFGNGRAVESEIDRDAGGRLSPGWEQAEAA